MRVFDGIPDFDDRILPALARTRFFRLATEEEVTRAHEAYERGGAAEVIAAWRRVALPHRVHLDGVFAAAFSQAGLAPAVMNGLNFLATVRAAIEAGKRFRARLSPRTRAAIETEFPWLERRHEHIPHGYTPDFDFPRAYDEWIDAPDLDDARARWQLLAAFNEVQQTVMSSYLAKHFRVPELARHAAREEALALDYFAHGKPPVTRALFRQCVILLDAVNAGIFSLVVDKGPELAARAAFSAATGAREWKAFVSALDTPQWLAT